MGWTVVLAAIGALVAPTAGMHSRDKDSDTHVLLFLIDDLSGIQCPPSTFYFKGILKG